jgi:hypothetical protein
VVATGGKARIAPPSSSRPPRLSFLHPRRHRAPAQPEISSGAEGVLRWVQCGNYASRTRPTRMSRRRRCLLLSIVALLSVTKRQKSSKKPATVIRTSRRVCLIKGGSHTPIKTADERDDYQKRQGRKSSGTDIRWARLRGDPTRPLHRKACGDRELQSRITTAMTTYPRT